MNKVELKELVKRYFNLTEIKNTEENITEKFTEAKLADGTVITNMVDADFEPGQVLHVITEEGEHVVAPSGEHTTESGIVITVNEEGVITGVHHPDQEGEGSLEAAEEVEMSAEEEVTEEKTEMAEHEEEEMMEDDIKSDIISAIAEVVMPELEALKAKLAEHEEKLAKYEEKMSATPANTSVTQSAFSKKVKSFDVSEINVPKHKQAHYKAVLSRLEK